MVQWGSDWLAGREIEQPRLDVELLLADALDLSRMDLFMDMDRPLDQAELAAFKSRIKRRSQREPVAYILGKRGFWKQEFVVNPSVLIPRPETETLIEAVLSLYPDRASTFEMLDLGVGSGTILYSLLGEFTQARGVGIDLSDEALQVAKLNGDRLGLSGRVTLLAGDLTAPLYSDCRYDLIVSNPPYIVSKAMATLQPEVRDQEPHLALDGGEDGLSIYRRLIPQSYRFLEPSGWLVVEIGYDQGKAVPSLFTAAGFESVSVSTDYGHRDRVVMGMKK